MSCNELFRTATDVRSQCALVQKPPRVMRGACVASLILLTAAAAGCSDPREAERSEARTLLTYLTALSDQHSLQEQHTALDRLHHLPLKLAQHQKARAVCEQAHRELLDAEAAQASAQKALKEAGKRDTPDAPLSAQQAQRISADIERSNRALSEARTRFPACEQATRQLLTRAR